MIVGPGVVVPAELAAVVARAIGRAVRDGTPATPALLRLVDDLERVAAVAGSAAIPSTPAEPCATVRGIAELLGVSERTVYRRLAAGRVEASKEGRRWVIVQTS